MKVSVLMSVLNGERFLRESLDSVLAQTHRDLEVLVYDDGSTDGTAQIIAEYRRDPRVRAFSAGHRGISGAGNYLIDHVRGDAVAFFAHDDVMLPESIAERVRLIEDTGLPVATHAWTYVDEHLRPIHYGPIPALRWDRDWRDVVRGVHPIGGALVMMRREIAAKVFPIPANVAFEDWWAVVVALSHVKRFAHSDRALVLYRQHGGNDSAGYNGFQGEVVRGPWPWRRIDAHYAAFAFESGRLGVSPAERRRVTAHALRLRTEHLWWYHARPAGVRAAGRMFVRWLDARLVARGSGRAG